MYHWLVMADSKPAAYGATVAAPFAVAVERARPHTKLIGLLALGHFVIDVTQGSLPAVLPFLNLSTEASREPLRSYMNVDWIGGNVLGSSIWEYA